VVRRGKPLDRLASHSSSSAPDLQSEKQFALLFRVEDEEEKEEKKIFSSRISFHYWPACLLLAAFGSPE
jgi:hypothetical protein